MPKLKKKPKAAKPKSQPVNSKKDTAPKPKKKKIEKISLEGLSYREAATAVCVHLENYGFDPILVGKSSAAMSSICSGMISAWTWPKNAPLAT